jgi:hypothetical protein
MARFNVFLSWHILLVVFSFYASESLNLAIVYDEAEDILPRYTLDATSMTVRKLFESSATPILMTGNLAISVGLFCAPLEKTPVKLSEELEKWSKTLREMRDKIKPEMSADDKKHACELIHKRKEDLRTIYFGAHSFAQHKRQISVDQIPVLFELLKNFSTLCEEAGCESCVDEREQRKSYMSSVDLSKWHLYLVKDAPQHLVLFVPHDYALSHDAFDSAGVQLERLGFDKSKFEEITAENLVAKAAGYEFNPELIAASIKSVFLLSEEKSVSKRWNILVYGHGRAPEAGTVPIQLALKKYAIEKQPIKVSFSVPTTGTSAEKSDVGPIKVSFDFAKEKKYVATASAIAGMPGHEFLKLMDFFTILPTNVVVYDTCYGGGTNAQAIQQLFDVVFSIARVGHITDKNFPIVISLAGGDRSTTAIRSADYKGFFEFLSKAVTTEKHEEQITLLQEAVRNVSTDKPRILFPRQPKDGTEATDGKFTYLIEPDYILGTGADGQLELTGALATKTERVTVNDQIVFNRPGDIHRIVLATDAITKPLIFSSIRAPDFDIETPAYHITFDQIIFLSAPLVSFFGSFVEQSKPLWITIKRCVAKAGLLGKYFDTGVAELVDLQNVQLFIRPSLRSQTDRGELLFTYIPRSGQASWYIFALKSLPHKPLAFELRLRIPIPSEKFESLYAVVIDQLLSNNMLAMAGENTFLIAQWFGKPLSYAPLVDQSLLERALKYLTIDKQTWERARAQLSPDQERTMDSLIDSMGDVGLAGKKNIGIEPHKPTTIDEMRALFASVDPRLVHGVESLSLEQKNSILQDILAQITPISYSKAWTIVELLKTGAQLPKDVKPLALVNLFEPLSDDDLVAVWGKLDKTTQDAVRFFASRRKSSTVASRLPR